MESDGKRKWCHMDDAESNNCAPKRLKCLASDVKYAKGNNLLHQFVLDNSYPNKSGSETYINGVLLSFSGTFVNEYNEDGYNPLHLAVLKRNKLMVKKLLSCIKNIDIDMESDNDFNTALHLAVLNPVPELLDEEAKDSVEAISGPTVNLDIAKLLLENGANTEAYDQCCRTPVVLSAMLNKFEFVSLLCEKGANVSEPLQCHRIFRYPRALKLLLDKGADVNIGSSSVPTPLLLALWGGHPDAVKLLVDRGADVNASGESGVTPLHMALECHQWNVIKMLINRGANVNAVNDDFRTPLHTAVLFCELDIIKILVDGGANVNSVDVEGFTPFHYSVEHCNLDTVSFLINSGANVKTVSNNGESVLHSKMVLCHPKYMKFLVNKGADVNARDGSGCTPLHCGAKLLDRYLNYPLRPATHVPKLKTLPPPSLLHVSQILISLINLGADVNSQDEKGNTPLHYACEMGNDSRDAVKLLVGKGANVNIPNKSGITPIELAEKNQMNLSHSDNV